ncbi:sensor histidine kinase [Larkinella sp. VNQ87]|uniref:sensor histidine kinase n=1 Tax=Larkinella sp. VNQ87 TaxID=3400921 RepID=UPI003BFDAE88
MTPSFPAIDSPGLNRKTVPFGLVAGWLVLGILYGVQQYLFFSLEGISCSFWGTLVDQVPNFLLWSGYSLLILNLNNRFPLPQTGGWRWVGLHLGVATALAVLHILALGSVRWVWYSCCDTVGWQHHLAAYSRAWFFFQYVLYGLVLLLANGWSWYDTYRRNREQTLLLEKQLTEAELQILKMQLNPHFLFNALNTVSMLIRVQQPEQATQTLASLGHLLREYLKTSATQLVSVEQELTNLQRYLSIEQVRFRGRFQYDVAVSPELGSVLVPDLLLQPLVENALRHGFREPGSDCRIAVRIEAEGDRLVIQIRDNGCGFDAGRVRRGIGLENTTQRLAKIYGGNARFRIVSAPNEGTEISIHLPITRSETHVETVASLHH